MEQPVRVATGDAQVANNLRRKLITGKGQLQVADDRGERVLSSCDTDATNWSFTASERIRVVTS